MSFPIQGSVTTPVLEVGYEAAGESGGEPVILLHGFPYDVRAYDEVAEELAASGRYVLAPYLRGYGPTRFRDERTLRSGQQAAIGQDLLDFMDALGIERAVVAGYDWGGRLPVSPQPCGRSESRAWSPAVATRSRTSRTPMNPRLPRPN